MINKQYLQTMPVMPADSLAVPGKDTLLYIKVGEDVWALVGGQKNTPITQKAESLDGTDKTSGGWAKGLPGMKSWSIEFDGLLVLQDMGLQAVRKGYREGRQVYIRLEYATGAYQQGWASVTEFSDSNASNELQTVKISFTGYGPISDIIEPEAATITNTTTAAVVQGDTTFKVTPADSTIRVIEDTQTGRLLTPFVDYTLKKGILSFSKEYVQGKGHTVCVRFATTTYELTITGA